MGQKHNAEQLFFSGAGRKVMFALNAVGQLLHPKNAGGLSVQSLSSSTLPH
jgi:hypothetical protein